MWRLLSSHGIPPAVRENPPCPIHADVTALVLSELRIGPRERAQFLPRPAPAFREDPNPVFGHSAAVPWARRMRTTSLLEKTGPTSR